ncbi:PH domain-containing protein [Pseudonocardia humida]|uniref:PH domain-containing protein n=1 Tax=Pseudonocardia humida TaxID=2800819 RepID=A0ABT1A4T7_9PSEU|nr:PH domain-containing protein [Pseudonocardia humida]MCO1658021.1 PH domain-containing protein [Pseudonocardia humida]
MDADTGPHEREWSPAVGLVVIGWAAAVAAVAWCVLLWASHADPAGRLIAGVAAVGLVVAALYGTRARPRLRVDVDGITVGGLLRARHYPWPLVGDLRVLTTRRLGLRGSLLEIDATTADGGERLLVFGRLDLDEDPQDVAPQVLALRPARGRPVQPD